MLTLVNIVPRTTIAMALLVIAVGLAEASPVGIQDCDRYGADPLDDNAITEGVPFSSLNFPRAIDTCASAMSRYPQEPRFMYQFGRSMLAAKDYSKARRYFKRAHSLGYPIASAMLGHMYLMGIGTKSNFETAIPFLRKGADGGVPFAFFDLAYIYRSSEFAGQDIQKAMELYAAAANAGHARSMNNLAVHMYCDNFQFILNCSDCVDGRTPSLILNDEEALRWLRLAAKRGNQEVAERARQNLQIYENSLEDPLTRKLNVDLWCPYNTWDTDEILGFEIYDPKESRAILKPLDAVWRY